MFGEVAHDDKRLGATPAITMVLHTWTRELIFHPHVHAIVSAGGLRPGERPRWVHGNKRYLFPVMCQPLIGAYAASRW